MRTILILGGSNMFGGKAYETMSRDFNVFATFRDFDKKGRSLGLFNEHNVIDHVDAFDLTKVENILGELKPAIILNTLRVTRETDNPESKQKLIYVNALFPHLLAQLCTSHGCKLIHFSTDCVFSGKVGDYTEEDVSDATSLYGRTKSIGEVLYSGHLTIRTSRIGLDPFASGSVVNWFLGQAIEGKAVDGYAKAMYSGLTARSLCRELVRMINEFPHLAGLYHISAGKISKFDLLCKIRDEFGLTATIRKTSDFSCDRSLVYEKYRLATGYSPPSWDEMVVELAQEYSQKKQQEGSNNKCA